MRAQATLALLLVLCTRLHGQLTFMSILNANGAYQGNLIELPSQHYLVAYAWSPGVSRLNSTGGIDYSGFYWVDSQLSIGSIKKCSDNEYYFSTGFEQATCAFPGGGGGRVNPAIGKMDSLGNVLTLRHYTLNAGCFNYAGNMEILSDATMVAWGKHDQFFVLKVDSAFAPVWAKRFSEEGSFRFIKELPSGDLLAGFDLPTAGASVARLDANGNFIWCKSYFRPLGRMHDAIVESDSSFVITGFTSTTNAKLFMMELDGDGEVQWCKGYSAGSLEWHTPIWGRLKHALDGNYAMLATLGTEGFFYRPFLMKTDLNGDTLWARSLGEDNWNYGYYTQDLLVTSDGGYLFSGVIWGDLPDMNTGLPYIYKTDSLGNLPCLSRNHPVQLYDLFPTDSSFTLLSTDGATMHQAFVSDTTFAPLAVYDACEVANAVRPYPDRIRNRPMRIRPNPNTGRFTLEVRDPLMAESYYSVYDALGKLLYQRPLPAGATVEEIDLSRFGPGTYVLRLTDPEGSRHERVVVE